MLEDTVKWFHQILGDPRKTCLRETINARYYNHKIRRFCDNYKCDDCVKHKLAGRGYGLLPEREVTAMPFQDLATDLIRPWVVPVGNKVLEFNALTCIDMCTNLVELVRIKNKSAEHISRLFARTWLARYPRPDRYIHDNGGEFYWP